MRKILALILSAALCLCTLLPALAEDAPAAAPQPITTQAYQEAYEALLTTLVPGCTVTWTTAPMEGGECAMAMVDESFIGAMVFDVQGQATEIAVLLQADTSETALMTFLSLSAYAGAALQHAQDVPAAQACEAFMDGLLEAFTRIMDGQQPGLICGLPGIISISPMESGSYQYYFVLQLPAAE